MGGKSNYVKLDFTCEVPGAMPAHRRCSIHHHFLPFYKCEGKNLPPAYEI